MTQASPPAAVAQGSGRIAIVTGAGRGLGHAIALGLAHDVDGLLVADAMDEPARQTISELEGARAVVDVYVGDLAQPDQAAAMADQAMRRWGRVDVLVNNAGGGVLRPFLQHDEQTIETTLQRNLMTTIRCCQSVLPHMMDGAAAGRVVNIGADSVRNGLWMHAMYNAAKGGVHGLTTGLARELAPKGITVNCVAPSIIATEQVMRMRADPDQLPPDWRRLLDDAIDPIPVGRPGELDEVVAVVRFLASTAASFVTGQVISVNGGNTML